MEKWFKDDLDRLIVRELQRDARESTSKIATRLNVARSTVHERITRMEREHIIAGYSVILSRNPSSEGVQTLVLIEVKQQDTRKVLAKLGSFSEIRVCLSINGEYDLFVSIDTKTIAEMDVIIDAIGMIPGVVRTNTFVVFGRRFDRRYNETMTLIASQLLEDRER